MKNKIFIILFICILKMHSQTTSGIVNYTETFQLGIKLVKNKNLYFDSNRSFYEEIKGKKTKDDESDQNMPEMIEVSKDFINILGFNLKTNDIYFTDIIGVSPTLILDSKVDVKWKLLDKKKKIGKFNCQKATGRFRGRNYTVWFTSEIPVPFGPWKLNGLPGLILEVTEENNVYHAIANNIEINSNVSSLLNIKFKEIKKDKAISLKEYIKRQSNVKDEIAKFLESKMPKGEKVEWKEDVEEGKPLEIFE